MSTIDKFINDSEPFPEKDHAIKSEKIAGPVVLSGQSAVSSTDIDVEDGLNHEGASNSSALFHVVCIIAGTGILQIPYSLTHSGWTGLAVLCFSAFVNDYTGKMLVKCLYIRGERIRGGLPEVGRIAFGKTGEYIVQFFYCSILLGVTCLYLVLSGNNFYEMTGTLSVRYWILISAAMLYIPFVALRTLKEVAIVSFLGVVTSFIVGGIVCVLGLIVIAEGKQKVSHMVLNPKGFPMAVATYSFSYGGNYVYPEVEKTMKNPKAFPKMLTVAMVIVTLLYVATAAIGYAAYGDSVLSPVLDSLPKGPATTAAFILITVHALLACPLLVTTFSTGIERWVKLDAPKDTLRQWSLRALLRTAIAIFVTVVAYFVPYFENLMHFLGAVDNTALIYIFPVIFYYKIHGIAGRSYLELGFALFLMLMGLMCGSIGGVESVLHLIKDIQQDKTK